MVAENSIINHRIILPPKARGTVTYLAAPGNYSVDETVLEVEFDGEKHKYSMMQVGEVAEAHILRREAGYTHLIR